jgi:diaminohydroxyphosphoribosylaminopyrimidine deaminase/5-amino-6-(5-phosphoribosylamino)uracil reductase
MQRCLELAKKGAGYVAPNPMVGAMLVHNSCIIGEGWHQNFGGPHAEVNCINSVKAEDRNFISASTLYVSLEPCAHFGRTPPCTDVIIRNKIPKVVIGCQDPFKEVDGKGIEQLKSAGVEVVTGILEEECKELNKRFFTFHNRHRPYVILKWAQTADGYIAPLNLLKGGNSKPQSKSHTTGKTTIGVWENENPPLGGGEAMPRLFISNEYTNRLVHQWRSEEASILVGTNTVLQDDPQLNNRLWPGPSPVRLVIDMHLRLPELLKVFDGSVKTIVFNGVKQEERNNLSFYKLGNNKPLIPQWMNALYSLNLQSVLVEGGAKLLQSFIDEGVWDEAWVIKNEKLIINYGLAAPVLPAVVKIQELKIVSDTIQIFKPAR